MTTYTRRIDEGDEDFCVSGRPVPSRATEIAAAHRIIADLRSQLAALASVTWCDTTDVAAGIVKDIAMWERGIDGSSTH